MSNKEKLNEIIKSTGLEIEGLDYIPDKTVDFTKANRPETKKEIEEYIDSLYIGIFDHYFIKL